MRLFWYLASRSQNGHQTGKQNPENLEGMEKYWPHKSHYPLVWKHCRGWKPLKTQQECRSHHWSINFRPQTHAGSTKLCVALAQEAKYPFLKRLVFIVMTVNGTLVPHGGQQILASRLNSKMIVCFLGQPRTLRVTHKNSAVHWVHVVQGSSLASTCRVPRWSATAEWCAPSKPAVFHSTSQETSHGGSS